MHPAYSVIFFTTASGAGYGLWIWLGLRTLLDGIPDRAAPGVTALVLGGVPPLAFAADLGLLLVFPLGGALLFERVLRLALGVVADPVPVAHRSASRVPHVTVARAPPGSEGPWSSPRPSCRPRAVTSTAFASTRCTPAR